MEGRIKAICISEKRGTVKRPVECVNMIKDFGIENDAHAGNWHRQVSLLSHERVVDFNERGGQVKEGDFGENLLIEGFECDQLPVDTLLTIGEVVLKVTQIGKHCHSHCEIYKRVGECIMPKKGIFSKVITGGTVKVGDTIKVTLPDETTPLSAAIITLSDKGYKGEREDKSGPAIKEMLEKEGYLVKEMILIPDEPAMLKKELITLADQRQIDLILTTGGTGFSLRDQTPEATMEIADRNAPGISEYMRFKSAEVTDRAMLSRGVSVIRKKSLIINLPGSEKAVRENLGFIIHALEHGIKILKGSEGECGR